ncbi:MAG: hypothetical protein UT48_C0011G0002 [Parcubacteria group bacterium GW2011_GWE2_39_37]|uniref:Uncharacterized protein n=1 Tax=Candidatus Falkowbacteria bacterium GW2011_GWF2_39_8 TaxID=1618642 RepID=A0A0G0T5T9_9BACT|nr:MAG: hypothetical protein UT48_C0011G0002 [Parcubacteria group bacterium GW2011_GWE2_39_37]KKR33177.1 MAG: hypothetical protein UT64_C0013G0009 [Candidatus Falkowbacteria bacterium GW2011_GWF2_39_8]
MKEKFIYDYYYFGDLRFFKRHNRQWMLFDQATVADNAETTPRAKYGKTLAELLPHGLKMKRPIFFFVEPTGAQIYIPVTLINNEYSITILAIPDSGAQVACFNGELASPLGIDISKLKKAKSFEGPSKFQVDCYPYNLDVIVGNAKKRKRVTVDFLKPRYASSLLGWNAFFATHEVCFNPDFGIKYRLVC